MLLQDLKQIVRQCLSQAAQLGKQTIAFPPLGTGRRFGYPEKVSAKYMVSATLEFLKASTSITVRYTFSNVHLFLSRVVPLKQCLEDLVPLITAIVSASLSTGIALMQLKQAFAIPLLKKYGLDPNSLKHF